MNLAIPNRKLYAIILAVSTLLFFQAAMISNAGAAASYSKAEIKKIEKVCKDKIGSSAKGLVLGGCTSGYTMGLEKRSNSSCTNAYKKNAAALKACKVTGYALGKSDAAKIGGKKGAKGAKKTTGPDPEIYGANDVCGSGDAKVKTSINIGCQGKGNPILDMLFAFIRFLSAGVGLVIVGSMVFAGVQYTTSRGDPQATAQAVNRIQSSFLALLLFIFTYAILNYLVPAGLLK